MKRRIILAATAVLVPLLTAAPAGAVTRRDAATAPHPSIRACDEGRWPASVQGQPASFEVGGPAGYYVWHDAKGWHLRTTTPRSEGHTFAGRITASDGIKLVHVYKNEPADSVAVSGKTLRFSFDTHDHVDGVDFTVGCAARLRFELSAAGGSGGSPESKLKRWPANRIRLGLTGHARSNPFTVTR